MNDESPVVELTPEECWELLGEHEFGRLAFTVVDEQHITPINYAVDRDALGNQTLLFRTAPGAKLLAVEIGAEVAFEIDDFAGETAVSVVVRGHARHLGEDEEHRAETLPLRPWVGTPKYDVVEIVPAEVTGRRFRLDRPWLTMRPSG
ncbi:pyridoxamine 5'-phosphate oxidase family protein [Nocardioides sp. MAH-18]|uniref:Pyridoxamine 5'-phosphate oxidase family protein n=1 Tax=Nocardioides agri TaxID=2682843 RepID=A0A6L6XR38_9ACTN|nr:MULTISPECIES: pyridoxamine 5'-phosphate oxidase family protein [unclassified Nocardioides]MBA2954925.1 pyridoxamine 5'-phosphate oxidase family protein [Nocardioides sp. CGMCC 1.13656]MVQ49779.1 pyridoxamine 5'-phosphate oxidase family protein [Nocardioides sp. MAH-18]